MRVMRLVLAVVVGLSLVSCTSGGDDDAAGLPAFSAAPSPAESAAAELPSPAVARSEDPGTGQIAAAYHAYTAAVSQALANGDATGPDLRAVTRGRALRDARARVRANREDGVVTTGELTPSATAADVAWDGDDRATVTDCVLNGLEHVNEGDPDTVVTEATGTRRPVEARLTRTSSGWVVNRVEMVHNPDADQVERDPPVLRGPMADGPPSCAPPELEREILTRYQAFWDAFDRAFGFGRDGPADPDDPALAETSVDPQLSDTREFFAELKEKNQTSEGERDEHDPWVLGLTDFDTTAFVADCVTLGESQTVDLDTGDVQQANQDGRLDYYESRLAASAPGWRVAKVDIAAEGLDQCSSPE